MDWIDVTQDNDMWWVVGTAMKMGWGWGYFLDQLRTC